MAQPNEAIGQHLLDQLMNLFVYPEIARRQKVGEIEKPLNLRSAQILFFPDGRKPLVRINSEIKAIGKVRLRKPRAMNKGDPVREDEIADLDEINRPEEDYPNCGHATLIRIRDRWTIAFDFRLNKALAQKHIAVAYEFLRSAEGCRKSKDWHPFYDNLFNAAELSVRAIFLTMMDETSSHRGVSIRFNRFADLGNVDPEYKKTFNRLYGARDGARYLKGDIPIPEKEAQSILSDVKGLIRRASTYVG
jgi:uncharacterized protein (UPF0332 family)